MIFFRVSLSKSLPLLGEWLLGLGTVELELFPSLGVYILWLIFLKECSLVFRKLLCSDTLLTSRLVINFSLLEY